MAIIPVPSLSSRGWLTTPSERADALLSHFFESDAIQSYVFSGSIANIQDLIKNYGTDVNELASQLQVSLERYLARYFDRPVVSVKTDGDVQNTNRVKMSIRGTVVQDGLPYSIGALVGRDGSSFRRIIGQINTGNNS